ncbi:response regulator, partial [bacterium]|nr:response regulator [bacterium]
ALPLVHEKKVLGVLVFGSCSSFLEQEITLLERIARPVAVAVNSANSSQQMQSLLLETQSQKEALQTREEELTANNEELDEANRELEKNSAELEEQASHLKSQQRDLEDRNKRIELANRYKSEFLANMSHELRTPLNSILLLSNLMAANKNKQLSDDDVESAQTINKSGRDLLNLINEVLDLAKVESGRIDVQFEKVTLRSVVKHMEQLFLPICAEKDLEFVTIIDEHLPEFIDTDQQRLEQILKNLLSNSCKFTESGRVTLQISQTDTFDPKFTGILSENLVGKAGLAFMVADTGIGIASDRHDVVFEAFQQADGSTSRKFGGTGLGLSISREMASLLGGEILMISSLGKGSTFTLFLPEPSADTQKTVKSSGLIEERNASTTVFSFSSAEATEQENDYVSDDRQTILDDDKILLIIDDDPVFAAIVRDMAREQQFKVLVAKNGEIGLQYADQYIPTAIILDLGLPGMDGWSVLSRLKESGATRHIPVHIISASDREGAALRMGALNFITKPVDEATLSKSLAELLEVAGTEKKKLLLVEDEDFSSELITQIFKADDIEFLRAKNGSQAMTMLTAEQPDCVILDMCLPDMGGEKVLEYIRDQEDLCRTPVIVYTGKELTSQEQGEIDQFSQTTLLKGVSSHERLLAQATLFMHRVEKNLPHRQHEILKQFYNREEIFKGKMILLVDDDMRNVFSLRKILMDKSMTVVVAKDGKEALDQLANNPDINLVLMDIMMPVM